MNAADAGLVNFNNTNAVIGALTGSRNLNLGASSISIGNNNASTNFSGALTNTGSIVKIGSGTLTLSGTNTYSGNTTVSAGTLALSGGNSTTNSANLIVAANAVLDVSGLTSAFTLAQALSSQTLSNSAVGAVINGTNNCSAGTLALVYDGVNPAFIITNGAMTISSATVFRVNNTSPALNPGTYRIISRATNGNPGLVTGAVPSSVTVTGNGIPATASAALQIDGAGNLNLVVSGPQQWSGASDTLWTTAGNWVSGVVPSSGNSIQFGNLSIANLSTVLNSNFNIFSLIITNPTGAISIGGANTLAITNGINMSVATQPLTITVPVVLGAAQTWTVTNGVALNVSGNVSGSAALTVAGGGTVTLGGTNTYTGNTTVSAGTLSVTGPYTGAVAGTTFLANGGSLAFSLGSGAANFYGDGYANSPQIGENTAATLTLQSGTLNINSRTGAGTSGNYGSLRLGNVAAGNGAMIVNGGILNVPGRILSAANGSGTARGTITLNSGALTVGTVGSAGSYAGTGGNGQGVLWFGAGISTVNLYGGTLSLWSLYNQAAGSVSVNLNGGTLKAIFGNATFTSGAMTMRVSTNGFTFDAAGYAVTNSSALIHDPAVTGLDGGLTVNDSTGTGRFTLLGTNTYSGNTTVSAGTLALGVNGSITNSANLIVAANAVLDVSGLTSAFTLAQVLSSQTLSNSAVGAVINGTNNCSAGTLSLIYDGVNPSFIITNGAMTISSATVFRVNNTGATLTPGTYKIISRATGGNAGLVAGAVPSSVTVTGGPGAGSPSLSIVGGELYLTVGGTSVISYTSTGPFTYDGAAHGATPNFSGSTGSRTTNYVGVSFAYGPSANAPTNAGTYYITNTVAGDANYFGATASQTFVINPLAITVTADAKSKIYGASDPALTYTNTPALVGGDSFTGALSRTAGETIGSYAINQGSLALNTNYTLNYTGANLTITPAALGITANSTNKTYGATLTFAGTEFSTSGLQFSDSVGSVTLTSAGAASSATVGSYSIVPSAAIGTGLTNYNITYNDGTLTVVAAGSSLALSSSANPSGYLDSISFTANLSPTNAAGSVTFFNGATPFSTNTIAAGVAVSDSISTLARGTNVITATYLGDANFIGFTNTLGQVVTNHPPVANSASYSRNAALNTFKIAVTNLLTNTSDADGDTVSLVSAGASTNSALVLVGGGYVLYYNTNSVADQFTYTVSDGQGGTNSASVNIAIDTTPLFGQSQIANTTGGTAELQFAGVPGYSYSVYRSTNLVTWTSLWTTNAPAGGVFQYTDDPAPQPSAYYRLQFNP